MKLRALLFIVAAILVLPRPARADAVDEAFARGNAAAERGDWSTAVEAYRQADALLPHGSSILSYNLGTAYLHAGDLGRATLHLHRALDFRGGPTTELLEAARHNLDVARRRAELEATNHDRKIDRADGWWDLALDGLRGPGVGWIALVSGWLALVFAEIYRRRRRAETPATAAGALAIVSAIVWLVPGVLHGLALRQDRVAPTAIVVEPEVEVREGPGAHRAVQFAIQAGARTRVIDDNPGWSMIRLPGGLSGWVPDEAVVPIERSRGPR